MLLAGAVPGEFEVRFKNLLTEISESEENIVLFVDDVHQLIGAGLTMGAMDAANILKPVMAGGKVKIIGAITTDEYKKYIEKDKAFSRRFQRINIDEPSIEEAIAILQGVKGRLEQHHHLTIEDEAIESAVKLSARYITDRCLPDKAIDLVDEAAAHLRLAKPLATRSLTHDDIQGIVARVTGIPAMKMNEDEESKLLNLESYLRQSVIGQDSALEKIAKAIRRSRMGMSDENRPIGSFLFMGSTGVGKTETCKALAEYLFDSREMMIRIDMSEYQQEQSVARLFGAPPGYIGYEQGGQLTEAVRHKSYSVVLFDELEKAHPKIFESLLQVLDDGRMTDGQGRVVNFKNTIVVMTSNIQSIEQLRHRVAPEFINRIDDIVTYNQLDIEQIRRIAKVQIDGLQAKLQDQGIALQVDSSVCDFLTQKGFNPEYGARPVKRAINSYLLDNLSTAVLAKDIDRNRPIYSEMNGDCITFHN